MLFILILIFGSIINDHADNRSQINVYLNNKPLTISPSWIDSIASIPATELIRYKITGAHGDGHSVTTRIRIPQVLPIGDVVKQIILYYQMLDDSEARLNEELFIFPYFTEPEDPPSLRATFRNSSTIYIELKEWRTIKRPAAPNPIERDIYNQIIEDSFDKVQEYEKIPDETFKKVARENNISHDRVIQIYKNVIMWQLTR